MSDYYCTNCGADLGDQYGFDPEKGYWTCTECGTLMTDPDDTITLSMRRRLLVAGMSRLSKEDTCNLLCKMKLDSLANILIDGKRPRVEVNSENKQILDAFVSNDYIEAYQPDEGGTNYKIIRKKEKH